MTVFIKFEKQKRCISEAAEIPSTIWIMGTVGFSWAWWSTLAIPATGDVEAGGWRVQGLPGLQSKHKTHLDCTERAYVKRRLGSGLHGMYEVLGSSLRMGKNRVERVPIFWFFLIHGSCTNCMPYLCPENFMSF